MTDLLSQLEHNVVQAIDYPLGWLLWLPRDVALVLFAVGTGLLMTFVRRVITNQDLLRRCACDLRRLKQRIRNARQMHDKSELRRLRSTVGIIKQMQLSADFRVLFAVAPVVALLAVWASARFDYHPPGVNQDLVLQADFPISSIDQITHLVPTPEFELKSPPIQVVQADSGTARQVTARWNLRAVLPTDDMALLIRHQGATIKHHVAIGKTTYLNPHQNLQDETGITTEVLLQPYKPLGLSLASQWLGLPPWMIGYVLLTLVAVPAIKMISGTA